MTAEDVLAGAREIVDRAYEELAELVGDAPLTAGDEGFASTDAVGLALTEMMSVRQSVRDPRWVKLNAAFSLVVCIDNARLQRRLSEAQ